YDLYSQIVGSYYAGLEAYLGSRVILGADMDYYVPTYDADSIWNWFTRSPITTVSGRGAVDVTKRFAIAGNAGARIWSAAADPNTLGQGEIAACKAQTQGSPCTSFDPSTIAKTYARDDTNRQLTTTTDFLANLSGRYRFGSGNVGLRGMIETGSRGR